MISAEIKEKDLEVFKDRTNAALTLGGAKYADVVIIGDKKISTKITDEIKPSKIKKSRSFLTKSGSRTSIH